MATQTDRRYQEYMQARIITALLLIGTPVPALACSPATYVREMSDAEIRNATGKKIAQSDAIVDGTVIQKRDGAMFLKPIKVWKGKHRSSYYISNTYCGVSLAHGTRVRALLQLADRGWHMTEPLLDRKLSTSLFDRVVDAHLGNVRPKSFENGALPIPPLPE